MSTISEKLDALDGLLQQIESDESLDRVRLDIQTAQRQLEDIRAESERIQDAAQKANQDRDKFVSVVSHELRIPMTSIKGYTDLLSQSVVGPVNGQQIEFLNIIRNNVDRMSTLISNLSDISKLESGRMQLDPTLFYLSEQADRIHDDLQTLVGNKSQTLMVEIDPNLPQVYADVKRVTQVISIMLDNAHRYTPTGGKIRLYAQQADDFLLI
jgi:signal transduction histidine kinase